MSFKGSYSNPFPEAGQGNENLRQWGSVQIAGYQIECQIGHGGMATVYRAVQQSLGRQVAIKILAHYPEEDNEFAQRFKKEGRILAGLLHPNIITIYDVGISENNQLFLSIEYLPGGTLGDRIKQGLSLDSAIQIVRAIAKALGYAHERGIVHRDVKPSNIMFRYDGNPILTDFGVARTLESKTIHTMSGLAIGSPGYMSPEQAMGESATVQSDLYSLGVVFYEMLAGQRLYKADNPIAVILKHLHDPIPELPKEYAYLQPILNKMLAKHSLDRYKNTGEFLEALDSIKLGNGGTKPRANADINHISLIEFTIGKIQGILKKNLRWPVYFIVTSFITLSLAMFYLFKSWSPADQVEISESDKQHEQAITTLLKQAEMQLKAEFLAEESSENNAKATYQYILTLDPGNFKALVGLEAIARKYEKRARQQLDAGALQESLDQIKKGLVVDPKSVDLLNLLQEVERQITKDSAPKAQDEEQQQSQLQAEQFFEQAQRSFQEGLLEISLVNIEQGLLAMPSYSGLLELREQVKARVAEQQRQEQETRQKAEEVEHQKIEQARQQKEAIQRQAEIVERQKAEQAYQKKEETQRQAEAGQYLARALNYRRNGKYSASLQQIEKGLKLVPNHEGLLGLREKVRAERSAEQRRQDTLRQAVKETKAKQHAKSQSPPTTIPPKEDDEANLKELQSIKNAIDVLDKSLGK